MKKFTAICKKLSTNSMFVIAKGMLDIKTTESFDRTIKILFYAEYYRIIIDFGELIYISSSGISLLVNIIFEAKKNNGKIVVLNPRPNVIEIFNLLGIIDEFTIAYNQKDAQKILGE